MNPFEVIALVALAVLTVGIGAVVVAAGVWLFGLTSVRGADVYAPIDDDDEEGWS